jgi:outer membrane lipoprotein-sorting protein
MRSRRSEKLSWAFVVPLGLLLAGGTLPISAAHADQQGYNVLARCLYAAFGVDYSGTRQIDIYKDGAKAKTLQQTVLHKRGNKQRVSMSGGQMVVMNGQKMWEYFPARSKAIARDMVDPKRDLADKLAALRRTAANMNLRYEGTTTVAGRSVYVVQIIDPRGQLLKRVWADAGRGVELAAERYDSRGNITFSSYFTQVSFSPTFPAGAFDFQPPAGVQVEQAPGPRKRMTMGDAERAAGFAGVLPTYLPPGYSFDSDAVSVTQRQGRTVLWLTFSNGVDSFSLFESGVPPDMPRHVPRRVAVWTKGPYLFALVGRLPDDEASRIKAGLNP